LQATQVRYHDKMLELQITASGMPALEALRNQLNDQGLKPQLGEVSSANGQVSGLIKVQ
jgi:type II secretory pathway component PulL